MAEVLAESFHSRTGWMYWVYPLLRLGIYEDLRHQLRDRSPHYICLVAARPDKFSQSDAKGNNNKDLGAHVAGTVEMSAWSTDFPQSQARQFNDLRQYPYISNLAVRAECRRRGVAQQLLSHCEQTALTWGYGDIYLHVLENNYQAQRLYFNRGYRLQRVECGWSCWLLGHPRRLLLHKRLTK